MGTAIRANPPTIDELLARARCAFIHGWDLAAATGQDTALDADVMQSCRQTLEPRLELFREARAFAMPLPVPPGATGQTRFLAIVGRAG
jgi:hypothetical protein